MKRRTLSLLLLTACAEDPAPYTTPGEACSHGRDCYTDCGGDLDCTLACADLDSWDPWYCDDPEVYDDERCALFFGASGVLECAGQPWASAPGAPGA